MNRTEMDAPIDQHLEAVLDSDPDASVAVLVEGIEHRMEHPDRHRHGLSGDDLTIR